MADLRMTCEWLVNDLQWGIVFAFYSVLLINGDWSDLSMTCQWLVNDSWVTYQHVCLMTHEWLANDLWVSCTNFWVDGRTKFRKWLANDLWMTCEWLANDLQWQFLFLSQKFEYSMTWIRMTCSEWLLNELQTTCEFPS